MPTDRRKKLGICMQQGCRHAASKQILQHALNMKSTHWPLICMYVCMFVCVLGGQSGRQPANEAMKLLADKCTSGVVAKVVEETHTCLQIHSKRSEARRE